MENTYYNLSEEELSKSRKILLWSFAFFFFLAGIYTLVMSLVLGHKSIAPTLSAAPFGICLAVSLIALYASIKRKDLYFSIDNTKIEFRYGIFRPNKHSFNWADVNELKIPHKQRKAMLLFKDGSSYTIDLTWLHKKKSSLIRKHIYQAACEKDLKIIKVMTL